MEIKNNRKMLKKKSLKKNSQMFKNKKGISYFAFMAVFILILFGFYKFYIISPSTTLASDIDFGATVKNVSMINAQIPAETLFKEMNSKLNLEQGKNQFAETLGLNQLELIQRAESNQEELLGCKIGSLQLWYNEKNINENARLKAQTEEVSDIEDADDSNTIDDKYSNCMPKFNEDFEEKLEEFFTMQLTEDIEKGLKAQGIFKLPSVELNYNVDTQKIETEILTYYEKSNDIGKVSLDVDYVVEHSIDYFPLLLTTMSELIGKIPQKVELEVPACVKVGDKNEIECITTSIYGLIETENPELINEYDFDISFMDDVKSEEYYGIKFEIIKKTSLQTELEFGIVLEDNIPYSLINFDVEIFESVDNTLNVLIDKPRFSDDVSSYVVLYSYDNFFDKSSSGYDSLITLLQENQIPSSFTKTGISDSSGSMYYYSSLADNENLNLILTSKDGFIQIGSDETPKKRIKVYQTYNKDTNSYDLLDNKRPVYVFAFATDKNYNYYVAEVEGKTKNIIPQTQYGPSAPNSPDNKVGGTIANY